MIGMLIDNLNHLVLRSLAQVLLYIQRKDTTYDIVPVCEKYRKANNYSKMESTM